MARLRKMLGSLEDPSVTALKNMIQTQSKKTLAAWAADYTEAHCLPIYEQAFPQDPRPRQTLAAVRAHLAGELKLNELKPLLKTARTLPQQLDDTPAAQAAARAISTACAVIQTPTNALGFTFYSAAAAAYSQAGLNADPGRYDALASAELARAADTLRAVLVPDESEPVKVDWHC